MELRECSNYSGTDFSSHFTGMTLCFGLEIWAVFWCIKATVQMKSSPPQEAATLQNLFYGNMVDCAS